MDAKVSNGNGNEARNTPRDGDYIQWDSLPPGGPLNRWSHSMTKGHDYVGAQVSPPRPTGHAWPGYRQANASATLTRPCSTPQEFLTPRP